MPHDFLPELVILEHLESQSIGRSTPNEKHAITGEKVWLITGAGRGLGVHIAKAALAAGHALVATGRDPAKVAAAVGDHDKLLAIRLDVTRPQDAQAAVEAAVARFGRIDILVNNAGNFFAGFFEELEPEQVRNQIETLLFGPMNVTRTRGRASGRAPFRCRAKAGFAPR